MQLQFFGAVRSVTGSMHVLTVGGKQVLLECGLYQGRRDESKKRNRHLPFDPAKVDAATLSHAHIDHSGNLPNLVKNGYDGRIWATPATIDLARVLLKDSAFIQQRDAEYLNKKIKRKNKGSDAKAPLVEPIYTAQDAEEAGSRFESLPYRTAQEIAPGVRLTFYDAGHILGSAVAVYECQEQGRTVRVGFTGDLGRPHHPILRDPQVLPRIDYLITESTYGNRLHESAESMKDRLQAVVQSTFEDGGRVIIPAFSVGRTQNLLYYLAQLFHEGALPRVRIFVDSPLAINATEAYRAHPECYDAETRDMLEHSGSVFGFELVTYTRSTEESMQINTYQDPCIVISASGMCEGGRILHHLKHGITKPENTVLIVGYQAEHTLGRRLIDRAPKLRIYGREYRLRARVQKMNGFSAHGDRDEMATYIKHIPGLRKVFVVHGEEDASMAFASYLMQMGIKAHVPTFKEAIEL